MRKILAILISYVPLATLFALTLAFAQGPPAPTWYGVDLSPMPAGPTFPLEATTVSAQASGPCAIDSSSWTNPRYHNGSGSYLGCAVQQSVNLSQTTYSVPTAEISIPATCVYNWDPWIRTFNIEGYDTFGDTLHCITRVEQQVDCQTVGLTPTDSSGKCGIDLPHPAVLELSASCHDLSGHIDPRIGCPDSHNTGQVSHAGTLQIHMSQPKTVIRIKTRVELTTDHFDLPPTSRANGTNRRDVGPEIASDWITVRVQPTLLMTLDVLPFKIIYAPPGDQSYGKFDEQNMSSDGVTYTLGSQNANAITSDVADEASTGIGLDLPGYKDLFGDTNTQSWEHSEQTTTTTMTTNTKSLTLSKQFEQSWQTVQNDLLDQPGSQPWVNDIFVLIKKPRIVLWDFGPDATSYAIVGDEGQLSVTAGALVQCGNSASETDPANPLSMPPQECSSIASLDPFAAASSQNAGKVDAETLEQAGNECNATPGSPIDLLNSAGQFVCYGTLGPQGQTAFQTHATPGLRAGTLIYNTSWQQKAQSMNTSANGGSTQTVITDIRTNKNVTNVKLPIDNILGAGTTLNLSGSWTHTDRNTQALTLQVNYQKSVQIGSSIQDTGTIQYQDKFNPLFVQQWLDRRFGTFLAVVPAPTTDSLSLQESASMRGGETITITGAGFMSGAIGVKFCAGWQSCADGSDIEVHNDRELTVKVPAAPPSSLTTIRGSKYWTSVYVISPGGWSTVHGSNAFAYKTGLPDIPDEGSLHPAGGPTLQWPTPTLRTITSGLRNGSAAAGAELTIAGTHFDVGGLSIQFCTVTRSLCVYSDPPTVNSPTSLTVETPELPLGGLVNVWASNWGGRGPSSVQFTYVVRRHETGPPDLQGRCIYCDLMRAYTLHRVILDDSVGTKLEPTHCLILCGNLPHLTLNGPTAVATRGDVAGVLASEFSLKTPNPSAAFRDVRPGEIGFNVAAATLGFIPTPAAKIFDLNGPMDRQAVAAAIVNLLVAKKAVVLLSDADTKSILSHVPDGERIEPKLRPQIALAIKENIVPTTTDGLFNPDGPVSRQAAAELIRSSKQRFRISE
jgi:hypothetical protein